MTIASSPYYEYQESAPTIGEVCLGNSTSYFKGHEQIGCPQNTSGYSPATGWWLAECSKLSYETKAIVACELNKVGFKQITFFDTKGTQAFLAQHPGDGIGNGFAVLAFRGTEKDYADILTDINFFKGKLPEHDCLSPDTVNSKIQKTTSASLGFYAHAGFVCGLHEVWGTGLTRSFQAQYPNVQWSGVQGISNVLQELAPDITLYVTGHSLGGALATIAAYRALEYHSNLHLYTFGSPRVVNQALEQFIDQKLAGRSYRVVHRWDIVSRIPPKIPFLMNYSHIQQLIYFGDKQAHHQKTMPKFLNFAVLSFAILDFGWFFLSQLVSTLLFSGQNEKPFYEPQTTLDHQIQKYSDRLKTEIQTSR
jgi:triacylglycerol lipase